MWSLLPLLLMPMVIDQALPSEVQSAVGSEWKASPVNRLSAVWPQGAPPSAEKEIAWGAPATISFEAARIWLGLLTLMLIADSLRGLVWAPEMRRLAPAVAARVWGSRLSSSGGGSRFWWCTIHSATSRRTSG